MDDLPIIQKIYDLIKWYVPILNRLPRDYKFSLVPRLRLGTDKWEALASRIEAEPRIDAPTQSMGAS